MPTTPVIPDSHRDLLDAQVAVLATNGPDGRPQLSAIWFVHDKSDDLVKLSLSDARQKTKNLRRNGRITLFIFDPATPYRTLEIRADAEAVPDTDGALIEAVKSKYGADVRSYDRPGDTRYAVILHPTKVNAADMRG